MSMAIKITIGSDKEFKFIELVNNKFKFIPDRKTEGDCHIYFISDFDFDSNRKELESMSTETVKKSFKDKVKDFFNKDGVIELALGTLVVGAFGVVGYIAYSNGIEAGKLIGENATMNLVHNKIESIIDCAYDIGMDCLEGDIRERIPNAAALIDVYKEANPEWLTTIPAATYNLAEGVLKLKE